MKYQIHIYNPANHTHIGPAVAAATTIGNALSISRVLAEDNDKNFCVVRGDTIVAFVESPSTLRAMQDAIDNALENAIEDTVEPYDGVPADTGSV